MTLRSHRNRIRAALCLILCLALLFPCGVKADKSREQIIFEFLRDDMGFGANAPAIACGILANIYAETGGAPYNYDPNTTGDGGTSGGICGWHDGKDADNWTRLKNYCATHGYQWNTLEGQLNYLKYDLWESGRFNDTRGRLMALENDMHGAWYAAYLFCYWYEGPANRVQSAINRGYYAEMFWNRYVGDDAPVTSGDPAASTLSVSVTQGPVENKVYSSYFTSCSLRGTVNSNYPITCVDCYVSDAWGNKVSGYNGSGKFLTIDFSPAGWNGQRWDGRHFDIYWDGADANLPFSAIDNPGSYFYCVDATDVSGKTVAYRCLFHVIGCTGVSYTFYASENELYSSGNSAMGGSIPLPSLPNRPGFLFGGWRTGGTTYAAGTSYTFLSPGVVFSAVWDTCPHRWDTGVVTEPTLTAEGYTTFTCLDCGASEQRDFTDPLPPPSPVTGDMNGDHLLNEEDLRLLARHVSGIASLTNIAPADVNGDGNISAADLTALAEILTAAP